MKKLTGLFLAIILLGLTTSTSVWARGADGRGSSLSSGGSGHFRGSNGGHSHFSSGSSHFGHSHSRFNLGINLGGFYGPGYYGYGPSYYYGSGFYGFPYSYGYRIPYYYPRVYTYPSPVIVPSTPPVYIQRESPPAASAQQQNRYWYYCRNPEGYYPYVKQCPEGWLQVAPQPTPQ